MKGYHNHNLSSPTANAKNPPLLPLLRCRSPTEHLDSRAIRQPWHPPLLRRHSPTAPRSSRSSTRRARVSAASWSPASPPSPRGPDGGLRTTARAAPAALLRELASLRRLLLAAAAPLRAGGSPPRTCLAPLCNRTAQFIQDQVWLSPLTR